MNVPSTVLKYIVSGSVASGVMFLSLVFFREVLDIWYLYSSTLAFVLAFITSFLLQKFWTFQSRAGADAPRQLMLFLIVSLASLGVNDLGMFVLVDKVGVWYFIAQVIMTTLIAAFSFFTYRAIFLVKNEI